MKVAAILYVSPQLKPLQCRSGGTGRHAILRGWWGNPWGFESPLRHQMLNGGSQEQILENRFFISASIPAIQCYNRAWMQVTADGTPLLREIFNSGLIIV